MATKQIGWLIALLVATPGIYVGCGGDDSTSTTGPATTGTAAGGSGGTGGSTGTGATGGTGTTGGTGGSGGAAPDGSAGSAGKAGSDAGLVDGRVPCGTANMGTGCNPNSTTTPLCDITNNRCVGCLSNTDCASQTNNKICDTRPTGTMMLPRDTCVACIADTDCPMGATCSTTGNNAGQCFIPCGTTMNGCNTNPTGNNICDAPNNRCVDCMNDADCAVETTNKHCDTSVNPTNMLPRYACEECLTNSHCMANQVCVDYNCEAMCTTDTDCSADGGGQTPHCNPTNHACAECGSDAHCSGNTPICIPAGTCEQCTNDSHCATQMTRTLCNTTNYTCVQCIDNTQCTAPQTCGRNGTCTGGGDGGGMPPMPDSGGGGG